MKKEMREKKKRVSGSWVGHCPFPSLGHDNLHRIVTQQGHQATIRLSGCVLGRAAKLRYGQPRARHDLRHGLRQGASGPRTRMAWPGVSRDTKIVSCMGAIVCVSLWHNGAAIQSSDMACVTAERVRNTARNACGMGLGITIQFCIGGGGGGGGDDTTGGNLSIRRSTRHDTTSSALPGHSAHAAWAQCEHSLGLGCAPCAPNPVLTQDTVLSYCFNHCSRGFKKKKIFIK